MTSQPSGSTGDIQIAVRHAMKLLGAGKTALAAEQAREILQVYPGEINSLLVVASALRLGGEREAALQRLQEACECVGQCDQWSCQDIGYHDIGFARPVLLIHFLRKRDRQVLRGNAIALSIITAGRQCLRVVVHAQCS